MFRSSDLLSTATASDVFRLFELRTGFHQIHGENYSLMSPEGRLSHLPNVPCIAVNSTAGISTTVFKRAITPDTSRADETEIVLQQHIDHYSVALFALLTVSPEGPRSPQLARRQTKHTRTRIGTLLRHGHSCARPTPHHRHSVVQAGLWRLLLAQVEARRHA